MELNFLSSQAGAVKVNVKMNGKMAITNYRAVKKKSKWEANVKCKVKKAKQVANSKVKQEAKADDAGRGGGDSKMRIFDALSL